MKVYYENRKNCRTSIGKNSINIRIPRFLDRGERFRQLMRMKLWARKKLEENPEKFRNSQKEYNDGDTLKVGNEEYLLRISSSAKQSSSAKLKDNIIYMHLSSILPKNVQNKHVSALLSRIIAKKHLPRLQKKIHELNEKHFNQKINKIFFKNNKSNWGSCSSKSNINISTRLLFAPDHVLEYVIIHELAHLIEKNHSRDFWTLVEKAMPDYKEKTKWLKENRDKCAF